MNMKYLALNLQLRERSQAVQSTPLLKCSFADTGTLYCIKRLLFFFWDRSWLLSYSFNTRFLAYVRAAY